MGKLALFLMSMLTAAMLIPHGFLRAQPSSTTEEPPPIKSELPPSPVREAVLEILKPEQWFKTLEQYIKVPLPGTKVKDIEVDREKVSELNIQISRETGVDILRLFQFIGKVFVIILEGIARLIRGVI